MKKFPEKVKKVIEFILDILIVVILLTFTASEAAQIKQLYDYNETQRVLYEFEKIYEKQQIILNGIFEKKQITQNDIKELNLLKIDCEKFQYIELFSADKMLQLKQLTEADYISAHIQLDANTNYLRSGFNYNSETKELVLNDETYWILEYSENFENNLTDSKIIKDGNLFKILSDEKPAYLLVSNGIGFHLIEVR